VADGNRLDAWWILIRKTWAPLSPLRGEGLGVRGFRTHGKTWMPSVLAGASPLTPALRFTHIFLVVS